MNFFCLKHRYKNKIQQIDKKKSGIKGPLTSAGGIKTTKIVQRLIRFIFFNFK